MATTSDVIKKDVTFKFSNDSTRKVTVGNFKPSESGITESDVATFKAAIVGFNDSDVSKVQAAYFSNPDDSGAVFPVTEITAANITRTQKTVIYAKSETAALAALRTGGENNGDEIS